MNSFISFTILLYCATVRGDVSHFFAPEYGFFQHQHPQYPFQVALQPVPQLPPPPPPLPSLPSLYAVPPLQEQPSAGGYPTAPAPAPVAPKPTPAPVAPPPSSTEFVLPEIVENRSAKERNNFIPLQNQYLPPDERPSYESPKPPSQSAGYYYPRPTTTSTTTTTTTTTSRPPIVVVDPPEFIPQSPINTDPVVLQPPNQGANQGYDYNAPSPPVFLLPSPRPSTPAPGYLPPSSGASDDSLFVEHAETSGAPQLRLHVKEMRCMQHGGGYFRSVLKVDSFLGAAPTVDNDSNDKRCELKLSRSYVVVDIAEEDFHKCGVHTCGKDVCLRLRFPAIRGMRTSADAILTLHCKAMDRVAVKTHALKMGVANDVQARSIGTYAHGGSQMPFRTHVELLRHANDGFTRHLDAHGAVQLGEELLLRAHVVPGDGWNYTKLTDVNVQRVSPSGELLNNAALVTTRGCINPSMQSVCTQPPTFDPPLGHRLAFKAVMFQGMRSGEELVISMRITGCLEPRDCHVDTHECQFGNLGRRKRNTSVGRVGGNDTVSANSSEVSEISRISFRVIMPAEERAEEAESEVKASEKERGGEMVLAPEVLKLASGVGFVLLLTCLGIFATLKLKK